MNEVAGHVLDKYKSKASERGVRLHFLSSPNLPPVSGDSKSLERALMALIDNAIKFSPRGGDVEVHMSQKDNKIIVSVQDHGIGIPEENKPRIFSRFYHLDRSGDDLFSGIGLGCNQHSRKRQYIYTDTQTMEIEQMNIYKYRKVKFEWKKEESTRSSVCC
jgi:signal transduction histidine kinase